MEEYAKLEALETEYWVKRAWRLAKEGYVGQEESDKLIQELLNAKD